VDDLRSSLSSSVHVRSFSCRADVITMTSEVLGSQVSDSAADAGYLSFMRQWHCCTRMVFGEDMLSVRNVSHLYQIKRDSGEHIDAHRLQQMIDDKMPRLGQRTCALFTQAFIEMRARAAVDSSPESLFKDCRTGMHVLLAAAWLDVLQEEERAVVAPDVEHKSLCSYTEFVTRLTSAEFHHFHPTVRLACWVRYLLRATRVDESVNLDPLLKLPCMDQVR